MAIFEQTKKIQNNNYNYVFYLTFACEILDQEFYTSLIQIQLQLLVYSLFQINYDNT